MPTTSGPDLPSLLEAAALHDATFALTSLGARQVATPGEAAARAWIESAFLQIGLRDVACEPFQMDAWRPGRATLSFDGQVHEVEALSPSPATDGAWPLQVGGDLEGAALLASDADHPSRAEAYLAAVGGGAEALIRITEALGHDGAPLVEVGHLLQGSQLPAVAVDQALGAQLRAHLGQPVALTIEPDVAEGHTACNVSGRIEGTGPQTVYVVAHYDSWHPSESAFDNALGVGALVQLARRARAAGQAPSAEIVFLATSGEEQGLQGAIAWVEAHRDEIQPGDLVLVLDVLWAGEGTYRASATDAALRSEAIDAAWAEGIEALDAGFPSFASDHAPFVTAGARAIWMQRWPDRHYHTVADTLDNLDLEDAAAALRAHWRLLAQHADLEL